MIGLCVALTDELRILEHVFETAQRQQHNGRRAVVGTIAGEHAMAIVTGMGPDNAAQAARDLIDTQRPNALIATGYAAGADPQLATGDLVIATSIYDPPPPHGGGPREFRADPQLLDTAESVPRPAKATTRFGTLVTVRHIVRSATEKEQLAVAHSAHAIDMESAAIAGACDHKGVPLLCVRGIVDEASSNLDLDTERLLTRDGTPRVLPIIAQALRRPRTIGVLRDLHRRSREAGDTLGQYLELLVPAVVECRP